ncbi:MAG: hypothetical protein RLN88_09615 [Ekhidna sp.]|uniref:hypothetical protein n=1 Tax=Ekhidna sp. TaxID=2608089 RepID=UPI0032EE9777
MNHHFDVEGIVRYSMLQHGDFNDKAFHLAVHVITNDYYNDPKNFSETHHHDFDEINVVIPSSEHFKYEIELDGDVQVLSAPFSIFIPSGCPHRALPLEGLGVFICIQFRPQ